MKDIDEHLLKLNKQLSTIEKKEFRDQLIRYINDLLLHDFNKLVQILYRIDVNEKKLKELLMQNTGTDSAIIITDLLIQRQEEKLKSRNLFQSNKDIPEEDQW